MAQPRLHPVDRPEVPPRPITERLRSQLVYFRSASDAPGVPPLGPDEFWIAREEVDRALEEGVILLVSPLDSENFTEVELSEEQEALLEWLRRHQIQHLRVSG
ncbi:hypothetical protein [Tautonia plasticadhaerens]|uniref:Uncharacterized protein n=1 Tax=Tautonia plasticadhaerens TaxID=2527974 RepID=A0A518H5P5_9BACT|nr:hypothetical protein [Tautonia plasticadhaerens]QDV36159.1 hypothetical protein ElP_40730 [Tautonia plasticadhaerens]